MTSSARRTSIRAPTPIASSGSSASRSATAEIWISSKIAWQVQRHFGRYGELRPAEDGSGSIFTTSYSNARQLIAWVLGLGDNARVVGPAELAAELRERVHMLAARHSGDPEELLATQEHELPTTPEESSAPAGAEDDDIRGRARGPRRRRRDPAGAVRAAGDAREHPDRRRPLGPDAARGRAARAAEALRAGAAGGHRRPERRQLRRRHLRALRGDPAPTGTIEVDPEPYGDAFARPARLLPVEAKALIAAIDLIGEHIPEGSLSSVRRKVVAALGEDPAHEGLQIAALGGDDAEIAEKAREAISTRRLLSFEYYKENEGVFSDARGRALSAGQRARGLVRRQLRPGPRGGAPLPPGPDQVGPGDRDDRSTPRTELDFSTGVDGWLRTGEVPASNRARVWISPDRARWVREERTVISEGSDGSVVVDFGYAGLDWLVRNVLKEAGDAVVLEPAEAREAVRAAAAEIEAVVPV